MATNRRNFIIKTAAGVAAATVAVPAVAAEPRLTEDDPIAIALGYKIDANDVDVTQARRIQARICRAICEAEYSEEVKGR